MQKKLFTIYILYICKKALPLFIMKNENTICAISTAPGIGGIAVIRVSGNNALNVCDKIYTATNGKSLLEQKGYTISFGRIIDGNNIIDEVLVSVFLAPHSFTGENCVEISCHGSQFIQQEILRLLISNGCSMAMPGEFTQRAFLNGKMDLSQAEAVADVIASQSAAAHRLAMQQMRGEFSNELIKLRSQLLDFTSLIELELDFSEEDIEFADRTKLKELANEIERKILKLTDSFSTGNAIKNGIPVAIIGETNAGKSTLLNVLVGEERAIVSEIHGTTRDIIEDTVNLHGVQFRFIDTAGIRDTSDTIENLGIERSYKAIEKANIVLWVINSLRYKSSMEWLEEKVLPRVKDKKLVLVFNKIDMVNSDELGEIKKSFANYNADTIFISAKQQKNTDELKELLYSVAQLPEMGENDITITNIRHYEALQNAHSAIVRVINGLKDNISGDFVSQDIRECLHYLGEITGTITTDEILGNIFSKFCIGK